MFSPSKFTILLVLGIQRNNLADLCVTFWSVLMTTLL